MLRRFRRRHDPGPAIVGLRARDCERRSAQLRECRHRIGDQGDRPLHRHDLHHRPARERHADAGVRKVAQQERSLWPADVDPAPAGLRGGHQRRWVCQGGARGRSQAAIVTHASGRRALEQGHRRPDRHAGVLPVVRIGRQPHRRAAAADFAEQLDHGQPGQQHPGRDRLRRQPAPPGAHHRRARRAGGGRARRDPDPQRHRQRYRATRHAPDGTGCRRRLGPRHGAGRSAHQRRHRARAVAGPCQPGQEPDRAPGSRKLHPRQYPRRLPEKRRRQPRRANAARRRLARCLGRAGAAAGHVGQLDHVGHRQRAGRQRCRRPGRPARPAEQHRHGRHRQHLRPAKPAHRQCRRRRRRPGFRLHPGRCLDQQPDHHRAGRGLPQPALGHRPARRAPRPGVHRGAGGRSHVQQGVRIRRAVGRRHGRLRQQIPLRRRAELHRRQLEQQHRQPGAGCQPGDGRHDHAKRAVGPDLRPVPPDRRRARPWRRGPRTGKRWQRQHPVDAKPDHARQRTGHHQGRPERADHHRFVHHVGQQQRQPVPDRRAARRRPAAQGAPADLGRRHHQDGHLPREFERRCVHPQPGLGPDDQCARHRKQCAGRRWPDHRAGWPDRRHRRRRRRKSARPGRHPGAGQPVQVPHTLAQQDQPDGVPASGRGAQQGCIELDRDGPLRIHARRWRGWPARNVAAAA